MKNIDDLQVIKYNNYFCIEADKNLGRLKVPVLSVRAFTYKFDYYDGFPFERSWCRLTLYANFDDIFDETLANDEFLIHINDFYKKAIRLRIYETKKYFLNKEKWFNKFYDLARFQAIQLAEKQKSIFDFQSQQKEFKKFFNIKIRE